MTDGWWRYLGTVARSARPPALGPQVGWYVATFQLLRAPCGDPQAPYLGRYRRPVWRRVDGWAYCATPRDVRMLRRTFQTWHQQPCNRGKRLQYRAVPAALFRS